MIDTLVYSASSHLVLAVVWLCGVVCVALIRLRGWRRIRLLIRASVSRDIAAPVAVRASPGLLEPGVVGWRRPLVLLPHVFAERLASSEIKAILAHELCHVRRRDNLLVSIHMIVEAIFWFHPLVWWIGARLIEEREYACDEDVVSRCNAPDLYAEAFVKVCKWSVESPLTCMAGVTGGTPSEESTDYECPGCPRTELRKEGCSDQLVQSAGRRGARSFLLQNRRFVP
jgi:bla regulator protein BlaR1